MVEFPKLGMQSSSNDEQHCRDRGEAQYCRLQDSLNILRDSDRPVEQSHLLSLPSDRPRMLLLKYKTGEKL